MTPATIHYDVRPYDMQRDGSTYVSGFQVWASVAMPNGRNTNPVMIALCPDKSDAEEIAELLTAKYALDSAEPT